MVSFLIASGAVIFILYRFRTEILESYSHAGRAAAPVKSRILPVPQRFRDILQKYFPYYQRLGEGEKRKFERKVCNFLYGKQFIPRNVAEVTIEAKVLIAATAVQLTFGLPDFYLTHFNRIVVYPDEYYSVLFRRFHKGEVNPRYGIIVLSWQSFIDGFIYPTDGKNLGLHEMAHALRLENMLRSPDYPPFDQGLLDEFDEHARNVCSQIENWSDTFFRPYACANEHEFFSVSIEHFFERPDELKKEMPQLYSILVKMLNQDPSTPATSTS
jgi:Mlc titration factor MtfA (ptsG expression regulator)